MGRPEVCASRLRRGHSPSQIAAELQITTTSVIDYLYRALGRDYIWLSDIVFAIPPDTREAVDQIISDLHTASPGDIAIEARKRGIKWNDDEFRLYLRHRRTVIGDLYFFITFLEDTLHEVIETVLWAEYGSDSLDWWEIGVPEKIRSACIEAQESDPDRSEWPLDFLQFSHCKRIIESRWEVFEKYIPPDAIQNKKTFLSDLQRAINIRNRVMHPVSLPHFEEEDFRFVRDFYNRISAEDWQSLFKKANGSGT